MRPRLLGRGRGGLVSLELVETWRAVCERWSRPRAFVLFQYELKLARDCSVRGLRLASGPRVFGGTSPLAFSHVLVPHLVEQLSRLPTMMWA